jgi:hypothetical protein
MVKRKTRVPDDWVPDDPHGLSELELSREVAKFRNHYISRGTTFADIPKAWANWVERSREFRRPTQTSGQLIPWQES